MVVVSALPASADGASRARNSVQSSAARPRRRTVMEMIGPLRPVPSGRRCFDDDRSSLPTYEPTNGQLLPFPPLRRHDVGKSTIAAPYPHVVPVVPLTSDQ